MAAMADENIDKRLINALVCVVSGIGVLWCAAKLFLEWHDHHYPVRRRQRRRRQQQNLVEEPRKSTFLVIPLGRVP